MQRPPKSAPGSTAVWWVIAASLGLAIMVFLAFRILQSNQERISALVRGDRQLPVGGVGQFDLS